MKLSHIFESKEVTTIVAQPISKLVLHHLKRFQKLAKVLVTKAFNDPDQKMTYDNIIELRDELDDFSDIPFVATALGRLDDISKSYSDGEAAKNRASDPEVKARKKSTTQDLEAAFLAGDFAAIESITDLLQDLLTDNDKISFDVDAETKALMNAVFTKQSMMFFSNGSDNVLNQFGKSEYEQVAKIDLGVNRYSYVDAPRAMFDSPEHMLGFMLNLTDGPNPKRLDNLGQLRRHSLQKYSNMPAYSELMDAVDRYLSNNRRELIPEIMRLLRKFPELERLNERAKRNITQVYRGIPDSDLLQHEVIEHEKESRYVATSTSYRAAENFAKAKGHLDAAANAASGWLLTYNVDAKSILLVTEILGTRYGESEVLIDTSKAQLDDIDFLEFSDESDTVDNGSEY